ncbi:MAG: GTPase HflX [Candidatus Omnitrophota bacterium]
MERVLLVTVKFAHEHQKDFWSIEDISQELRDLTKTAGAEVVDEILVKRDEPAPNCYIGKGKAEEIRLICQEKNIDTVIFNHDLSPTHQRNLEEIINKRIIDHTQLILDIFAKHAKTLEGKLQVELAQKQYLLPRLSGKGIELSRLGGGIGTRGPGEQKLEIDRRRISERIAKLKKDLDDVSMHRARLREKRKQTGVPLIGLVGYTNAGKTTLLNALTGSEELSRNSLFTTLDSVSRTLILPNHQEVVLFDTVGFLHRLPHHLVEAFKATLEEVRQADLLLHVLDISSETFNERAKSVEIVLKELGANEKPIITVLNKIDRVDDLAWLKTLKNSFPNSIEISALSKLNFDKLFATIEGFLLSKTLALTLALGLDKMNIVNLLHEKANIKNILYTDKEIIINLVLPVVLFDKISSQVRVIDTEKK